MTNRHHYQPLLDRVRRGESSRPELDQALDELVDGALGGSTDDVALLLEFLDSSPILRSTVRSVLFDETAVDDALQETLLAVSSSLDSFQRHTSVSSWAAGIARHKALDIVRRKGRPAAPDPVPAKHVPTELERFSSRWATHADVDRALSRLSPKLRPVFELADLNGCSYDEIAAELSISRNTVASRLRRARAQLQVELSVSTA